MGWNDHIPVLYEVARDICEEARAIKLCPECESEMVRCGDSDAESRAYAIATNQVKAGKIEAKREALMDAIESVLRDTAEHCIECDRREHRDD